jgi:outer membrane immunogenic protein
MKVRLQGMLATSAAAAALLASAGIAHADGMPGGPVAYERPALWTGLYAGGEFGWQHEGWKGRIAGADPGDDVGGDFTSFNSSRDVVAAGLFLGAQYQFGSIVLGAEVDLFGLQFDRPHEQPEGRGNCEDNVVDGDVAQKCYGRITNMITFGPRLGWAAGNWMPYVTGGWASGNVNNRFLNPDGTTFQQGDKRQNGWFAGGGLDWKLSRHAVVGIEYRHTDLGTATVQDFTTSTSGTSPGDRIRQRAEADSVMIRGSLLFNPTYYAAPLK